MESKLPYYVAGFLILLAVVGGVVFFQDSGSSTSTEQVAAEDGTLPAVAPTPERADQNDHHQVEDHHG